MTLTQWRGFDLSARRARIERACDLAPVTSARDVPVMAGTPGYFAFASKHVPEDYFTNPASMLEYQTNGYAAHLSLSWPVIPWMKP